MRTLVLIIVSFFVGATSIYVFRGDPSPPASPAQRQSVDSVSEKPNEVSLASFQLGLRSGDVILEVDRQKDPNMLERLFSSLRGRKDVCVTFQRNEGISEVCRKTSSVRATPPHSERTEAPAEQAPSKVEVSEAPPGWIPYVNEDGKVVRYIPAPDSMKPAELNVGQVMEDIDLVDP